MFTSFTSNSPLRVEYDSTSDSTVNILPGVARVNYTIMAYDGTRIPFQSLFQPIAADTYQNILVYLQAFNGAVDTTRVTSSLVATQPELTYPQFPYDTTSQYAKQTVALFTFYYDGVNRILKSCLS